MADKGWVGKWAFQDNGLAADSTGRAAMEDGFVTNAKVETGTLTANKLASGVLGTGAYGTAVYGTALYG